MYILYLSKTILPVLDRILPRLKLSFSFFSEYLLRDSFAITFQEKPQRITAIYTSAHLIFCRILRSYCSSRLDKMIRDTLHTGSRTHNHDMDDF